MRTRKAVFAKINGEYYVAVQSNKYKRLVCLPDGRTTHERAVIASRVAVKYGSKVLHVVGRKNLSDAFSIPGGRVRLLPVSESPVTSKWVKEFDNVQQERVTLHFKRGKNYKVAVRTKKVKAADLVAPQPSEVKWLTPPVLPVVTKTGVNTMPQHPNSPGPRKDGSESSVDIIARKKDWLNRISQKTSGQVRQDLYENNRRLYQHYYGGSRLLMGSDASGTGRIAVCAYLTGSKRFTFFLADGKEKGASHVYSLELEGLRIAWRVKSRYKCDRAVVFCDNYKAVQTAQSNNPDGSDIQFKWTKGHSTYDTLESKLNRLADVATQTQGLSDYEIRLLLSWELQHEFPWAREDAFDIVRL